MSLTIPIIKKPELVAPGGNPEKLKVAAAYGADAVYVGAPGLNLRARSSGFTVDDILACADFLHNMGKKLYVALNVFAQNSQLDEIRRFVKEISGSQIDALIISDPGVLSIVNDAAPNIRAHLSTQANTTNLLSVKFWRKQGVKRVVLARELSLDEIREINTESGCETEAFVHGAMCMSYSGRCLLSSHMTGRNANRGGCSHSCRWKYSLKEEKRPNELFPIEEDEHGTYILSSKDLCMIQFTPELINSGITAWKIEGRMKSQYYVAAVTRIYREAIDSYMEFAENNNGALFESKKEWLEELNKVSHRTYGEGFFFGPPSTGADIEGDEKNSGYVREHKYLGIVDAVLENNMAKIVVKNKIIKGSEIQIMGQKLNQDFTQTIDELYDVNNNPVEQANPGQIALLKMKKPVEEMFIMREDLLKAANEKPQTVCATG